MADDGFLRDFYRELTLGPLEPGDPRYVALYDGGPDPVERLMTTIEWSIGPSTQLLMGYRGTGKTGPGGRSISTRWRAIRRMVRQ